MSRRFPAFLIVLALIGLITLSAYVAVTPLLQSNAGLGPQRDLEYAVAQSSKPRLRTLLAHLVGQMDPANLTGLRNNLNSFAHNPSKTNDAMVEYLKALGTFANNMDEISAKLKGANASLAKGDRARALSDLNRLRELRDDTRVLLRSLYDLWADVEAQNEIRDSDQPRKLAELEERFQEYVSQISILAGKLRVQQGLVRTILTLNASKLTIYIEENLTVSGYLQDQNATLLAEKNITLSWGLDRSLQVRTNQHGGFAANVSYPVGFPSGPSTIRVTFRPEGNDSVKYLPSAAELQVGVEYEPSKISMNVTPNPAKPSDFVYLLGNLSTIRGQPLADRRIAISINGSKIGDLRTNLEGNFRFTFQATNLHNGTYDLTASFLAVAERFAPSNATTRLVIAVKESEIRVKLGSAWLLSGTRLRLNGTVTYDNNTVVRSGNVTVYFDGKLYDNSTIRYDGSFELILTAPLWSSFGSHSIIIEYVPDVPWLQASKITQSVFVYNTPVIIAAGAIVAATATLSVRLRRRRRRVRPALAPIAKLEEKPQDEFAPEELLAAINTGESPRVQIKIAYGLAQELLKAKLGQAPSDAETPREYYARITKVAPGVGKTLKRLVDLYELSEYGPYQIDKTNAKESAEVLLELRRETETVT